MIRQLLAEKKYYTTKVWSNKQLKKVGHLFTGSVLNVSGWTDEDKEGGVYKSYFPNSISYHISNFDKKIRGMQGFDNEFYLDLTKSLPNKLKGKYDVVYNNCTLEHIYENKKAFKNLCALSDDIVILVVPFLQQMHGDIDIGYMDYWRYSPKAIERMFLDAGFTPLKIVTNNHKRTSVYVFAIASKQPHKWKNKIKKELVFKQKKCLLDPFEAYAGCRSIINPIYLTIARGLFHYKDKFMRKLK